eukprot:Skav229673  [mRNA]  locus=scaffold4264:70380:77646:+ [translate_table: standard]
MVVVAVMVCEDAAFERSRSQSLSKLAEEWRSIEFAKEMYSNHNFETSAKSRSRTEQIPLEAKVELAKLQVRCKAAQRKAKTSCDALGFCYQRITSESKSAVREALRSAAKRGLGLRRDIKGLEGPKLLMAEVHAALEQLIPHSLTKQAFDAMLVVRDISLTDNAAVRKLEIGELEGLRELQAGECLELLEGPKEEITPAVQVELLGAELRLRGVSCSEEISGWLQIRSQNGEVVAEEQKNAMTDIDDLASCSMLRKIEVGEALEMLSEGTERRMFRACKDGAEAKKEKAKNGEKKKCLDVAKHYICRQASPVHSGLGAESGVLHVLMPGEAFMAFEDPKDRERREREESEKSKKRERECTVQTKYSASAQDQLNHSD